MLSSIALVAGLMTSTGVKATAITFASVGTLALCVIAFLVIRHENDREALSLNAVRFKVQISIVPRDATSSLFWLRRPPDTLAAIPISLYAVVTNIRSTPITLDSIGVEVRENDGRWKMLKAVPTYAQEIYWVYGIPAGLRDAGLLDFTKSGLDQLLMGKQIAPGVPVRGWVFFRLPEDFGGVEGTMIQWKFTAQDSAGDKFESITDPTVINRQVTEPTDLQPNPPELIFGPSHLDISNEIKHIVMP